ncbi:zinc-dependent alcohol dehydrogenase family protein [Lacisediminihabitans profunda]|uniref:Alcohol dehydrogenase catalytic domain-containing protein n=1 Tax=Lacisediminihabitans profunda TaxID=2594790 RepID=A0A5C8UQ27_9MICO|nr:zinc-binding dehydrogenase [Lacisediminihabitans profunda]TXN30389.1 alcohol dehydrogenase catalytic domain-containing protein [Lacisediminihabitans profunda]
MSLPTSMQGVFLPGNSTADVRQYPVGTPGAGELLIKMGASGICGSDIGYIYRGYKTHKGLNGEPAYKGVIAGHEPSGRVVSAGPGVTRFGVGDDVIVYHIHGCGVCRNCRAGYFISCSDQAHRKAYGWQRDGGHSDYVIVSESTCIPLYSPLTYADGALIACGFGTAYEGLRRANVHGGEDLLVVGLGPVGLAAAMIGRMLGARRVIGVERSAERIDFVKALALVDDIVLADENAVERILELTEGKGCEVSVDASGSAPGRATAVAATAEWGRMSLLGEGGNFETEVSDALLHKQLTINASWVTSLQGMEDLAKMLATQGLHPEIVVSHRLTLSEADEAYRLAAEGATGKVILVPSSAPDAA